MKRLLKQTIKKQFSSVASQRPSVVSFTDWFKQQCKQKIVVTASALTAATLSLVTGRPAEAVSIFPVDLSNYAVNSLNEDIEVTDTFGNTVNVNLSWTGDTGNFSVLGPSNALTGGFTGGSILEIQHDPALETEAVTLDIDFGAPIEQARLVVIDVDRDNANTWQDLIQLGGSVPPASITPATAPSTPFQVSPEALAGVAGIPLGIDQANGGTAPGLADADDYTVDIVGNEFVGVYNPRDLDANLVGAATRDEFTPINDSPTGGVDVNPTDPLPNPQNPPQAGVEAQNQSSEGTITADYSAVGGPLTNLTVTYGNGPAAVPAALNPAGNDGYITTNDANGGPGNHGVGLYTIFIVPGSIGTAKSASTPVQVSATEFDVVYTVQVQNFGVSTTLTEVQATDDLTQTFGGATGFTVVSAPTIISGPATLQTANAAFNGNGDQNLLDGTGSLAPGEAAVIQYTVRLDTAAANITPGVTYDNTVIAAGTTPIGLRILDTSVDDSSTPPNANPNPNPDPNGDGDPLEQSPTPVVLPDPVPQPQINVSEQFIDTEINPADGIFPGNTARVRYRVRVQNTGPERLTGVQLINDFTETFDNGTRGDTTLDNGFEIFSVTQVDGIANPANPNYDGGDTFDSGGPATNDPILATGGTLEPGEFTEYEILVDVDTTGNGATLTSAIPGTFFNSTTATGVGSDLTTPSGRVVSDISNDAPPLTNLVDALNPDGNSPTGGSTVAPTTDPTNAPPLPDPADPANENTPTPVTLQLTTTPQINVSEQVVSTVFEPTGTYGANTGRVTYQILVQNTGTEDLNNVDLINDFTETFDNGTRGDAISDNGFEIVTVAQVDGVANVVNPNYDGGDSSEDGAGPNAANDPTLITGGNLAVGEFSLYEVVVDVDLTGNGETLVSPLPGPFNNSTTTNGTGVTSTIPVSDISNDATGLGLTAALNPDGNSPTGGSTAGNPGDLAAPTPPDPLDPANENTPTPVTFVTQPQINVSEQVTSTAFEPTGTYGANTGRVTYRIRVQNTGIEDLNSVDLINDFTETFDNGTRGDAISDNGFEIVTVTQVDGVANAVNPDYDGGDSSEEGAGPNGTNDSTLITGGNLAVGEFSEYEVVVDIDLTNSGETLVAPLPGPFNNSTTTNGIGTTSTIPVSDISNDATGLDLETALNPPGNSPTGGSTVGNPGDLTAPPPPDPADPANENTPTPVTFTVEPQINVAEQVVSTLLEPTGTYGANTGRVTYRIRVQNTGVFEGLNNVTLTNDFTETFDNGTRGDSGSDNGFEIVTVSQVDGVINAVNPNYDGGDSSEEGAGPNGTNDPILITGGTLGIGEFSEYEVVVDVNLTDSGATLTTALPGPFDNFTTATGIGDTSTIPVSDISNDFTSVTPTPADLGGALNPPGGSLTGGSTVGNPGDLAAPAPDPADSENTPSPANFVTTPEISVIERIDQSRTEIGAIPGATFEGSNVRLVYQVVVRNIGIENLQNVVLNNDFRPTFGTSGTGATDDFTIVAAPTLITAGGGVSTVPVNPNFDGSSDLLLAGDSTSPASTLNVGEFAVYEIVVDVNTAGSTVSTQLPGPFDNQTTTTGIGVISGELTDDISNDINPFPDNPTTPDPVASDPNGNLEANEPDENIATPAFLGADLQVVKRITRVIRGGSDLPIAGLNDFTNQPGTTDDDSLASLSGNSLPLGVFDVDTPLQSGDVVEYTIYFFNGGVAQAANVAICDELQVPSVLQPGSLELASPVALSALGTNLTFAAGSPLLFPQAPLAALVESCPSFPGTFPSGTPTGGLGVGAGGGVIAGGPNLGLNVEASQVGAFRFTVTIP
ncbi:MAG: hypothetical protein AAF151_04910 [Cyanobacteria bacterium J06656_5]